jgi:hypothetical protein
MRWVWLLTPRQNGMARGMELSNVWVTMHYTILTIGLDGKHDLSRCVLGTCFEGGSVQFHLTSALLPSCFSSHLTSLLSFDYSLNLFARI